MKIQNSTSCESQRSVLNYPSLYFRRILLNFFFVKKPFPYTTQNNLLLSIRCIQWNLTHGSFANEFSVLFLAFSCFTVLFYPLLIGPRKYMRKECFGHREYVQTGWFHTVRKIILHLMRRKLTLTDSTYFDDIQPTVYLVNSIYF